MNEQDYLGPTDQDPEEPLSGAGRVTMSSSPSSSKKLPSASWEEMIITVKMILKPKPNERQLELKELGSYFYDLCKLRITINTVYIQ